MATKFTEHRQEQAIIALLSEQGYPHILGSTIEREPHLVLITDDLHYYLKQRYQSDNITDNEIDSIIRDLRQYPATDLYQYNKAILTLVSNGFDLKREDRSLKDLRTKAVPHGCFWITASWRNSRNTMPKWKNKAQTNTR